MTQKDIFGNETKFFEKASFFNGAELTGNIVIDGNLRINGSPYTPIWSVGGSNIYYTNGNIGIGTDNPTAKLTVYGTNQEDVIRISTGNNAGDTFANIRGDNKAGIRIRGGGSYDGGTIELAGGLRDTDPGIIKFNTGTGSSVDERLRITSSGYVGINSEIPARTLDVVGSIRKTVYEPGEIIEQLETQADGNAVTVKSGTYTPTNVTATQTVDTTHTTITGSSIDYTPPTGTTRVIYEFWCFLRDNDVGPIMHFAGRVAGTQVTNTRHTWRIPTANADTQTWIYSKMILRVGVTESLAAGDVGTWTSAKTLDFTVREYSADYEGNLHSTNHWDGTGTDVIVKPRIRITAIA
jgi:hypothetical protein